MTSPGDEPCPWPGVELRHLATLEAVARQGSFRGAARHVGYAQSAVSQQIATLERGVGAKLIERSRGPGPLTLTPAGRQLLRHAETILRIVGSARAGLGALSAGRDPALQLRLGATADVVRGLVPGLLRRLAADHPRLAPLPVEVADGGTLPRLLLRGELDAAIAPLPLRTDECEWSELLVDPYVLAVAPQHRLATVTTIGGLGALAGERLLGPAAGRLSGAPSHEGEAGSAAAQALAAAGYGVAVVPRMELAGETGAVAVGLGDLVAPRILALCWARARRSREAVRALRSIATRAGDWPG